MQTSSTEFWDCGPEFDARPGDVTALPPGHDAWVTGANLAVDGAQLYPSARRFD